MSAASWKSFFPFAVVVFLIAAQRVNAQDEIELLKRQLSAMQTMVQKMAERVEKLERERASADGKLATVEQSVKTMQGAAAAPGARLVGHGTSAGARRARLASPPKAKTAATCSASAAWHTYGRTQR